MPTLLAINNYHYLRGGGEGVFFEHNRQLARMGWDVVPFCMQHPSNLPTPWSEFFINELEFGQDYSWLQKAEMATKAVYSFEARRNLKRLLQKIRPDIAHCHNIYHHLSPSILHELKSGNIPTVMTLHDLKIACPAYKMLSRNEVCERCKGGHFRHLVQRRCLKDSLLLSAVIWIESTLHSWLKTYLHCVDRFVVPSRFFLEKFVEWGFPRERFVHVPNFIDGASLAPQFNPGQYFLYFGRLSEEKGVDHFVRACAQTGTEGVIVGTGPEAESLKNLANLLQANVRFAGYQTGTALHDYVRGARAVVLPSLWYENAPLSVMEATALGKPVLGAGIGGIPELIQEGVSGSVFESGSLESLKAAMVAWRDMDDGLIVENARKGRDWMISEFSVARYTGEMQSLYNAL
jgi:glycosyltransferase involved in cell wall biosynthesis